MLLGGSPPAAIWMYVAFNVLMHCRFPIPIKAELLSYLDATMDAHHSAVFALDVLGWINVLFFDPQEPPSGTCFGKATQAVVEALQDVSGHLGCPRNVTKYETNPC